MESRWAIAPASPPGRGALNEFCRPPERQYQTFLPMVTDRPRFVCLRHALSANASSDPRRPPGSRHLPVLIRPVRARTALRLYAHVIPERSGFFAVTAEFAVGLNALGWAASQRSSPPCWFGNHVLPIHGLAFQLDRETHPPAEWRTGLRSNRPTTTWPGLIWHPSVAGVRMAVSCDGNAAPLWCIPATGAPRIPLP